jgi:hypothetical protein
MILAILGVHLHVLYMLLEHENADVHVMNNAGSTTLDIARNLGMIEMTKLVEAHVKG